jgi:hypothetical protein
VLLKQRDLCLFLSWCLTVRIGVSSRLVSTVDWCLRRSVRVGWFLLGFVQVRIGVSSRLVHRNIL